MSDEGEWGDWQDHDGTGCPCLGQVVEVEAIKNLLGDLTVYGPAIAKGGPSWFWRVHGYAPNVWQNIIRYRIRRPRALLDLIDMVENLPAPADNRVDA